MKLQNRKGLKQKVFLLGLVPFIVALMSFTTVSQLSRSASGIKALLAGSGLSEVLAKYGLAPDENALLEEGLEALEACMKQYVDLKKFSLDVEYSVFYDSEDFDKPADKKEGKIIRSKDDFYQEEMGNIKVLNKDYELVLNKRAEFITVRNRFEKKIEPVFVETDSLAGYVTSVEKIADGYRYYLAEGQVEKFDLILDQEGYLKIWRSYYRDKMDFGQGEVNVITQLKYRNFVKNPKTDPAVFSLEPYVSITKKGEVTARGDYKNYYVLNQLQKL
ncbi:MAG: hypothetical protein HYZ14_06320 [Bacteroidetes bacterium]|nr:hypothetical protein [Bacteroidota bacterium]